MKRKYEIYKKSGGGKKIEKRRQPTDWRNVIAISSTDGAQVGAKRISEISGEKKQKAVGVPSADYRMNAYKTNKVKLQSSNVNGQT